MDRRGLALGLTATGALAAAFSQATSATSEAGELQVRPNISACEGCEAVAENDLAGLSWTATLAGPTESGERIRLTGRVFAADGVTPAPNVIIYAHHTNARGLYTNGAPDTFWSRRHRRLRGWVKTNADGRYGFDSIKPAPYPDMSMPAHVHVFVGEPGRRPYHVDDAVFDGEFRVDEAYRRRQELRGASGIVRLMRRNDGVLEAVRDIRVEPHPA